jgi:molybdopterin synthase sulfur carrier subunit
MLQSRPIGWMGGQIMEVKVLFFGVLSEVTGTSFKCYIGVKTLNDLKLRIIDDFPEIAHYSYRISVNNEITDNNLILETGDEIALMPPFAGG